MNISQIWKEHIDEKITQIPEGKSFIYFTDAHEGDVHEGGKGKCHYECLGLIKYLAEKANIKNVVFGGDMLGAETTLKVAKENMGKFISDEGSLFDLFGDKAIVSLGNHDTNCVALGYIRAQKEGYNPDDKIADILTKDTYVYENYIKPMESSGCVKYDEIGIKAVKEYLTNADINELKEIYKNLGYEKTEPVDDEELRRFFVEETEALFKFHYTYTDNENKIKYISVDCGTNSPMQYGVIKQDYTDIFHIQFYWLAYELMNIPKDYDIVVTSHMFGGNPAFSPDYMPEDLFDRGDSEIYDMTNVTKPIYEIFAAFKGNKAYKMPNDKNVQENNKMLKEIVKAIENAYTKECGFIKDGTVDFEGRENNGKILTLSGHWHNDYDFIVPQDMKVKVYEGEKITDQIPVIFEAACSVKRKSRFLDMSAEAPHSACFDVITLTDDKIVFTRIGEGKDRVIEY